MTRLLPGSEIDFVAVGLDEKAVPGLQLDHFHLDRVLHRLDRLQRYREKLRVLGGRFVQIFACPTAGGRPLRREADQVDRS